MALAQRHVPLHAPARLGVREVAHLAGNDEPDVRRQRDDERLGELGGGMNDHTPAARCRVSNPAVTVSRRAVRSMDVISRAGQVRGRLNPADEPGRTFNR